MKECWNKIAQSYLKLVNVLDSIPMILGFTFYPRQKSFEVLLD